MKLEIITEKDDFAACFGRRIAEHVSGIEVVAATMREEKCVPDSVDGSIRISEEFITDNLPVANIVSLLEQMGCFAAGSNR